MAGEAKRPSNTLSESPEARPADEEVLLAENPRAFTLRQKLVIALAAAAGYAAVALIGRSLRWQIFGWENWEAARRAGRGLVYTFWHHEIFSATWFWRKRGIVVMTSQNFDGEYIARIIQGHGYGAARGSSSRGGARALAEMRRAIRQGRDGAFTIDGPRGPRGVAKRGAVILAKATGAAILCFHTVPRRAWVFRKSWDRTEFPRPFTRAAAFIAPPIFVPPDAGEDEQARKQQEVQSALEDLERRAEAWRHERARGTPPQK